MSETYANMPLISIIIPVYNAEEYLSQCLDSILKQTYQNLEIIYIDDGSRDGSREILDKYRKADPRVVLITQPNSGVSAARNAGLNIAGGEYISFVDSDDWIHPRYIEYLLKAIEYAEIAHCEMERVNTKPTMKDEPVSQIAILNKGSRGIARITDHCWGKLFRRSIIRDIKFEEHISFGEDKLFTTLVLQKADKIALVQNRLYYYFDNKCSAVHMLEHDMFPVALCFLEDAEQNHNVLSLKYAYTGFISCRYIRMFEPEAKTIRKKCNKELRKCKKVKCRLMSFKDRAFLNLFTDIEPLYRVYRILGDRTMLEWENAQRAKYQNNRLE